MESESGLEMGGKSEYAKNGFFDKIFLQSLLLNWLHHLIIRLARRPRKPRCHRGIWHFCWKVELKTIIVGCMRPDNGGQCCHVRHNCWHYAFLWRWRRIFWIQSIFPLKKVCFFYESPWFGSNFYYFLAQTYEKPKNVTRYRVSSVLLACTSLNYQLHTHS